MSTAALRESWDTVFTDGDWLLDVAFRLDDGTGGDAAEDITAYDHYLTLKRRTAVTSGTPATPILLSTEDGTLEVTAPNLVGPRVRAPQLQAWAEGVYDVEQFWTRPDGITEVVFVATVRIQKGLSLGGSFASLPLPSSGPSLTVIRGPGQARIVRGSRGAAGWNGWTPVVSIDSTTAPPKRLMKIIDWAGGGGTKPTAGSWVGAGGLVTDPADAADFGGASTAAAIAALNAAVTAMQQAAAQAIATMQQETGAAIGDMQTATGQAIAQVNAAKQASIDQTALAAAATTGANNAAGLAIDKAGLADTAANAATLAAAAAIAALQGATGQQIVSVTAPRYLTAADHGKLLAFVGAAPALFYVPPGLPAGFRAEVMKAGASDVFVVPVGLTAVNATAGKTGVATPYASELLRQVAADSYVVTNGDASAAPLSINLPAFHNAKASGLALEWFA